MATGKPLQHFTIATLVLCAFIQAGPAATCSCGTKAPACQARFDASAVFVGTVLSIETAVSSDRVPQRRVHFEIVESFSGVTTPGIDIETDAVDDCAYPFVVNGRYLVFADRAPPTRR